MKIRMSENAYVGLANRIAVTNALNQLREVILLDNDPLRPEYWQSVLALRNIEVALAARLVVRAEAEATASSHPQS